MKLYYPEGFLQWPLFFSSNKVEWGKNWTCLKVNIAGTVPTFDLSYSLLSVAPCHNIFLSKNILVLSFCGAGAIWLYENQFWLWMFLRLALSCFLSSASFSTGTFLPERAPSNQSGAQVSHRLKSFRTYPMMGVEACKVQKSFWDGKDTLNSQSPLPLVPIFGNQLVWEEVHQRND